MNSFNLINNLSSEAKKKNQDLIMYSITRYRYVFNECPRDRKMNVKNNNIAQK